MLTTGIREEFEFGVNFAKGRSQVMYTIYRQGRMIGVASTKEDAEAILNDQNNTRF